MSEHQLPKANGEITRERFGPDSSYAEAWKAAESGHLKPEQREPAEPTHP